MNNKSRGENIRRQILRDIRYHPSDIVRHIAEIYTITPQAVHNHIRKLVNEERIITTGSRKGKRYFLGDVRSNQAMFNLNENPDEFKIWKDHFSYLADGIDKNVYDICEYGFTEIVNNAIDHSESEDVWITFSRTSTDLNICVIDSGEGIFRRIRRLCNLADNRESLLELSKGKFTTDPDNHSGEGIFFNSRAFDSFSIDSKGLDFSHNHERPLDKLDDSIFHDEDDFGTMVYMRIARDSTRTLNEVYEAFGSGPDEYQFSKTIIPVRLARYDNDNLVSRSQAKRLLSGLDKFEYITLDFDKVPTIGQAFSDQIFRVYQQAHPEKKITATNMSPEVENMAKRSKPTT